ncbi:MAG: hypothetical protein LBK99_27170 [Opitutaceae bacterium]|jgi:hypothetical protein|nr:hypothetical protein [Opitutaceae bacterium]
MRGCDYVAGRNHGKPKFRYPSSLTRFLAATPPHRKPGLPHTHLPASIHALMNLTTIIDDIASQADEFLEGTTSRDQARAGIAELLTADYKQFSSGDRKKITDGVMTILEDEGFFDSRYAVDAEIDENGASDGGDAGGDE